MSSAVPHERIVSEFVFGVAEKMGREVGEDVLDMIRGQDRRQVSSRAAGPTADLEHAQPPPLGRFSTSTRSAS